MQRIAIKRLPLCGGQQQKTTRDCVEKKRSDLRHASLQARRLLQAPPPSLVAEKNPWQPALLHFRANFTDLETWKKIEDLAKSSRLSVEAQELVASQEALIVLKELERVGNLALQKDCLTILSHVTATESGCKLMVPKLDLLVSLAMQWERFGPDISVLALTVMGNIAMENTSLRNLCVPFMARLAPLLQHTTPDKVVHRILHLLLDASGEKTDGFTDRKFASVALPMILRCLPAATTGRISALLLHRFLNALPPEDLDSFVEHTGHAPLLQTLLGMYQAHVPEAMLCIEDMSMGNAGMVLYRTGFFEAACKIFLATGQDKVEVRFLAATLLHNLYANEEVAIYLRTMDPSILLGPTIGIWGSVASPEKLRIAASDLLTVAIVACEAPEKQMTYCFEKCGILGTLITILQTAEGLELLQKGLEILEYLYNSCLYRARLFENDDVGKIIDVCLQRLSKHPDATLSQAATTLMTQIERLEQPNEDDDDEDENLDP